jgi:hypothetical protein
VCEERGRRDVSRFCRRVVVGVIHRRHDVMADGGSGAAAAGVESLPEIVTEGAARQRAVRQATASSTSKDDPRRPDLVAKFEPSPREDDAEV